ncbi:Nmad2 family putative nucleotide modification protein [Pseudomonas quasicaspiana]|uniref:Nmad2 family putative nucleotide modification protein n=1 Tax=Pseudomonas quasicaspiana TaxID=2829821 RepID=UPI0038738E78|nr:hypothetical protein [Pseudomonas quasicaspiana]
MPRIYSYVITHDHGFAPNPHGGLCTLATCKPVIRRSAQIGDWLFGTGSKSLHLEGSLIYAAEIDAICTLAEYGADPKYASKRPSATQDEASRHGDNIYFKAYDGEWTQRKNIHHDSSQAQRDLSGLNVLIASRFWYFGSSPEKIPCHLLHIIKKGPGHKCDSSFESLTLMQDWLSFFSPGINAKPMSSGKCGGCKVY